MPRIPQTRAKGVNFDWHTSNVRKHAVFRILTLAFLLPTSVLDPFVSLSPSDKDEVRTWVQTTLVVVERW